jgi:hypothetical protein
MIDRDFNQSLSILRRMEEHERIIDFAREHRSESRKFNDNSIPTSVEIFEMNEDPFYKLPQILYGNPYESDPKEVIRRGKILTEHKGWSYNSSPKKSKNDGYFGYTSLKKIFGGSKSRLKSLKDLRENGIDSNQRLEDIREFYRVNPFPKRKDGFY